MIYFDIIECIEKLIISSVFYDVDVYTTMNNFLYWKVSEICEYSRTYLLLSSPNISLTLIFPPNAHMIL